MANFGAGDRFKKFTLFFLLFLLSISPFLVTTKILFLRDHPVWTDESLFYDAANNWNDKGVVATNLYNGTTLGLEKKALWPPVYFYALGTWIRMGFTSIEAVRLLSAIFALLSFPLIYLIFLHIFKRKIFAFLGLLLISSDIWFERAGRIARMEMLVFLFLAASLYFFLLFRDKYNKKFLFITGVFSALAILTHTMGVMILVIYVLYILGRKMKPGKKLNLLLILVTPTILSLFLWILLNYNYWDLMVNQYFFHIGRRIHEETYLFSLFAGQQQMYNPILIVYLLIFMVSIISAVAFPKKRNTLVSLGLVIAVFFVLVGREMWYVLYLQPFITLASLQYLHSVYNSRNKYIFLSGFVLVFIQLALEFQLLGSILRIYNLGTGNFDYHQFTQKIAAVIPKGANILSAAIPDPYFDLKKTNPNIYEIPAIVLSWKGYTKILNGSDYAIINLPLGPDLAGYMEKNHEDFYRIDDGFDYRALVVKFTPREKRKY